MGLKAFTIDFKNIGKQNFLRIDIGYRYFFDIKNAVVYSFGYLIKLKYVLKEIPSKKIPKGDLEEDECLIDLANIERRFNNLVNVKNVSKIGSDKNILQKGDIIIPKMQPQMGNFFLNTQHNKYIGSTELLEYIILENYNSFFLYYLITSKKFLASLESLESGKTHRRVNSIDLLKIKIPLILKSKQDQVVAQIKPIEHKIKELKSQIKIPQDIINMVFAKEFNFDLEHAYTHKKNIIHYSSLIDVANEELKFDISLKYRFIFNKYVKNVSHNDWVELGKIVKIKGGKRLPKGQNITEEDTGFKYIRIDDLNWSGFFDLKNIKFISKENHKKIKNYIAKENDILLSIVGTIGKCGLVPLEIDGENITENFARLTLIDKNNYLPEYINYCLQSATSVYQIDEYKGKGLQGKLALFRIKKIKIPDINIQEQYKIVNEIKAELEKQEEIKIQIDGERDKIDALIKKEIN